MSKAILTFLFLLASAAALYAQEPPPPPADSITPARLSFIDGRASFWRPGAEDWAPARINTPLTAGDALYTGDRANLEIQFGPRSFIRAGERTSLGIVSIEPDFVQVKVTGGQAALDLRSVPPGHTVELDTPGAVFTIEHPGYYRVAVLDDRMHFITRRGGRATITLADGRVQSIAASEDIVVRTNGAPVVETYVAPEPDNWDRWNYARTDYEIEALSGRYVSPGAYGVGALDQWGAWRIVPTYGPVWFPDSMGPGWAPYTAGSWIWHAPYGWTWVDDAPWGWAPFHYGRWVIVNGLWAWAPGPVLARPVYAPALVAFFHIGPRASVGFTFPGPALAWVPLGWGEPLVPWWGRPGFIGMPWWGGWGGPRVVNNVVIDRRTVVNANTIVYHHTRTPRALVGVEESQFGRGPIRGRRLSPQEPRELRPIGDSHPARPGPVSLVPRSGDTIRPPAPLISRSVTSTRETRPATIPWERTEGARPKPAVSAPAPKVVAPPRRSDGEAPPRPSFGEKGAERPRPARPPQPPRVDETRRAPSAGAAARAPERAAEPPPPRAAATPSSATPRGAGEAHAPRALPGRPANETYRRPPQAGDGGRGQSQGAPRH